MLLSYQQAAEAQLAAHTKRFVSAALQTKTPEGLVISPAALHAYVDNLVDMDNLLSSVSDAASIARVENEVKRRFLSGRVPDEVADVIVESLEILGLDEQLKVKDIPLVAMLSVDGLERDHVIINVVGKKSLADAIRTLYSRLYTHPFPESPPNASIVLFRMPPLEGTAHVVLEEDRGVVEAVRGWGRAVGADEVADKYVLRRSGSLIDKQVQVQDSMVYRNPRSGQVVQTRPRDAKSQKVTDDEARSMVLTTERLGLSEAVFGFSEDKQWLLLVPPQDGEVVAPDRPSHTDEEVLDEGGAEESVEQETPDEVTQEPEEVEQGLDEAEVVIIDYEEEPEEAGEAPESSVVDEPIDEPSNTDEEVLDEDLADDLDPSANELLDEPQEELEQEPEPQLEDEEPVVHEEVEEDLNASQMHNQVRSSAQEVLQAALRTIELTLAEWLHEDPPGDFERLVGRVSAKRQVPYKNRILTLHEMRDQGAFEDPSPEAVRFALETLSRFRREF